MWCFLRFFGTPIQWNWDLSRISIAPFQAGGSIQVAIVPMLVAVFAFGATIFPRIPFGMGGGGPREVILKTKLPSDPFEGKKLLLIGESNQFLFLVEHTPTGGRALQLNKDAVNYLEIKNDSSGAQPLYHKQIKPLTIHYFVPRLQEH